MPRTVVMQQPLRQTIPATPQPSGSASAYLLIVPLSGFGGVAAAYGFSVLTGLPFTISLIVAAILYLTKMYFFRSQTPHEQMMNNGWDRVAGYLVTAFFFVALAAFGLYEFSRTEIAASEIRRPIANQLREVASQSHEASPNDFETAVEGELGVVSTNRSIGASTGGLEGFIKATLAQNANAIGCWIALLVMEVFVVLLVNHNRPRYIYPYM